MPDNLVSPSPRPGIAQALSRGSWREVKRVSEILRTESVGGMLLLAATILALIFANTGLSETYFGVVQHYVGADFGPIHLKLSVGHWAADGLLAVFFFLAGLELKQEFVAGDLRDPARAVIPVAAACGGVALPALFFALINLSNPEALGGWAIPTATDIAFALAVLAVIGSHLPASMRTFLLTLAIVDDLIAITIIAVFYTDDLNWVFLGLTFIPVAIYALVARKAETWFRNNLWASWFILLPIGMVAWVFLYNSGVHATIAGVLLAFTLPVHPNDGGDHHDGLVHMLEHHLRPFSAGFCVPVFAFMSAGVFIGGWSGLISSLTSPVALGIIIGLVLGKIVGITGATFLATRFQHINLNPDLKWRDVVGLAAISGIGFTVSLLICELSFGHGSPFNENGKVGILAASLLAAAVASAIFIPRNRYYKALEVKETLDSDHDGIPDVFENEDAE